MKNFLEYTSFIPIDRITSLLELVLNNCFFSFQGKFYQQLQGAAMGLSVSSVILNIYMEYFEEIALGPQSPIPTTWWNRYIDDIISIVKKEQVDTLFNHLNSLDSHIKFTIEVPGNDGSISILDTKYLQIQTTPCILLYTENQCILIATWIETLTFPFQPKKQSAMPSWQFKMFFSTPEILAKEMDYFHRDLLKKQSPRLDD